MKKLYRLIIACTLFQASSIVLYSDDVKSDQDLVHQTKGIKLNNLPISIFTPQTIQFHQSNIIQGATGATGATGPATLCLFNAAMLIRTLTGTISSGATATFDEGIFYRMTGNPTGSPTISIPTQSLTIGYPGYYLIEFSYAGDQLTTDPTSLGFYANFNLLVNGSVVQTFTLSTFGIRQIWNDIIFLNEDDVVSFQAASDIPFFTTPSGITAFVDGLIMTIHWIGVCLTPA